MFPYSNYSDQWYSELEEMCTQLFGLLSSFSSFIVLQVALLYCELLVIVIVYVSTYLNVLKMF